MAADSDLFSGIWHCSYWYPSNDRAGDEVSQYEMRMYRQGDELVLESLPNKIGSYMLVRLKVDDNLVIGNWHETTSPTGAFKGAMYSGAGELLLDRQKKSMKGKWAGIGYDRDAKESKIYAGDWEIVWLKNDDSGANPA
jgi:hypothetical protein